MIRVRYNQNNTFGGIKRFLLLFLTLCIALCVMSGLWLFQNINEILAENHQEIEDSLSEVLGTRVRYKTARVRFENPSIVLNLSGIDLGDLGVCGIELGIEHIDLILSLRALITQTLNVKSLHFGSPKASFNREAICEKHNSRKASEVQADEMGREELQAEGEQKSTEFKLELQELKLKDADFVLREGEKELLHLKDVQLDSSLQLASSSASLKELELEFIRDNKRNVLVIDKVQYFADIGSLLIDKASLADEKGAFRLSGNSNFKTGENTFVFSAKNGQLQNLLSLSGKSFPIQATVSGSLRFKSSGQQASNMTVDMELSKLSSLSETMSLQLLQLRGVEVIVDDNSWSVKGSLHSNGFKLRDGKDNYAFETLDFPFQGLKVDSENVSVRGDAEVRGFSFSDNLTQVLGVDAKLTNIDGRRGVAGNISLDFRFHDSEVAQVLSENAKVMSAQGISGPMQVVVKSNGEYKVSGEPSVEDVDLVLLSRKLSGISGAVPFSIQDGLYQFTAKSIKRDFQSTAVELNGELQMTADRYELLATRLNFQKGNIQLEGNAQRGSGREYSFSLDIDALPAKSFLSVVSPDNKDDLSGEIFEATARVSGNQKQAFQSMKGDFQIDFRDGAFEGFSFTESLQYALSALPLFGGKADRKDADSGEKRLLVKGDIENAAASLREVSLYRKNYTFHGKGSIDFQKKLFLKGSVLMLKDAFASFGLGVGALEKLLGRVGKIDIPIFLEGEVPDIDLRIDNKTFLKNNSGLALAEDAVKTVGKTGKNIGKGAINIITSPFRSDDDKKQGAVTPVPAQ